MLNLPQALDRDAIARRIPHQGAMCLLDAVLSWSGEGIRCETRSHADPAHPLRAYGRLGAACGVEYAAQAMAMHGALVAEGLGRPPAETQSRGGYLAGLRAVTLHVERLDDVPGPLTVAAQRITGDANTVLYSFTLDAGNQPLLSGRAIVVLDASGLAAQRTSP